MNRISPLALALLHSPYQQLHLLLGNHESAKSELDKRDLSVHVKIY